MSLSQVHIPVERPNNMSEQSFKQLKDKAVELEGVFLTTLLSQLTEASNSDSEFGGGYAEETWRGMMSTEYANEMAKSGGVGLSDSILRDLIAHQSASTSQYSSLPAGAYQK